MSKVQTRVLPLCLKISLWLRDSLFSLMESIILSHIIHEPVTVSSLGSLLEAQNIRIHPKQTGSEIIFLQRLWVISVHWNLSRTSKLSSQSWITSLINLGAIFKKIFSIPNILHTNFQVLDQVICLCKALGKFLVIYEFYESPANSCWLRFPIFQWHLLVTS